MEPWGSILEVLVAFEHHLRASGYQSKFQTYTYKTSLQLIRRIERDFLKTPVRLWGKTSEGAAGHVGAASPSDWNDTVSRTHLQRRNLLISRSHSLSTSDFLCIFWMRNSDSELCSRPTSSNQQTQHLLFDTRRKRLLHSRPKRIRNTVSGSSVQS